MIEALRFLKEKIYSEPIDLSDNFKPLSNESSGYVTAIDGGSCILADGGSWLISKLRIGSVQYNNGKRITSQEKKEEHYYTIIKKNNSFEHSIKELKPIFNNLRDLTEAPAITMRTLEFAHAYQLSKELPENSLLLIDGLLSSETPNQDKFLGLLEQSSKERRINVAGLAKTFRHSIKGQSIIGSLIKQRPKKRWCYKPVKGSDCLIIKLHEQSRYAYALSVFNHTKLDEILPVLSYYSTDPSFIGYPYPLLRVDRLARISGHEKRLEQNKLRIMAKKNNYEFIDYDSKSTDMHGIMDKRNYR